jgi:hypothetical protein
MLTASAGFFSFFLVDFVSDHCRALEMCSDNKAGAHTKERKSEPHTYIACIHSGALTVYIYNVLSLFMCVYAYVVKNIRDNKGNKPPPPLGIIKRW